MVQYQNIMTMMAEIRLVRFNFCQEIKHQTYIWKTWMQKRPSSREFRRSKSSLLKNVNKIFYFPLKMSFRGCLYESRDKIKIDTIFILPLYVDVINRDGINRNDEMTSVQLFWAWYSTGDSIIFPGGRNCGQNYRYFYS